MNTPKNSTTWRGRRARFAAGLIVVAIAAAGAGVSASGAGASNGWGRMAPPVKTGPAVVSSPVNPPAESLVSSSNGWG